MPALADYALAIRSVGLAQVLAHPIKAAQSARLVYSGLGGGGFTPGISNSLAWGTIPGLPGTKLDYAERAGQLWKNPAVAIGLRWIQNNYTDAVPEVAKRGEGDVWEPQEDHPLLDLLETPNEDYPGATLMQAAALSYVVDGNAYLVKGRSAGGKVASLDYIPHWQMRPAWPADGSEFISHYEYLPPGTWSPIKYDKRDVIHVRFGMDPENLRLGLAPLKLLLREVAGDNEASTYTVSILVNMGIPGAVVTPKPLQAGETWDQRPKVDDAKVEKFRAMWRRMTTGDLRGNLIFPTWPVDIAFPGHSPEQMALKGIADRFEDRICAALGLSSMMLNLTAGAGHKTYANMGEAREAAYYECLMPMQGQFGTAFTRSLLRQEYGADRRTQVRYNYEHVRVLQEDQDAKAKRAVMLYISGLATKNQGCEIVGLGRVQKPGGGGDDPAGDEYYSAPTVTMPSVAHSASGGPAPESSGDAAVVQRNGRVPAGRVPAALNGARKSAPEDAAAEKARLGEKWRERRRRAEEGGEE